MTVVLMSEENLDTHTHTHTHTCSGRIPDEHEFWVGDNVSTNQETPKMGRGLKQILSLSLS
jgi:hypothetical protein